MFNLRRNDLIKLAILGLVALIGVDLILKRTSITSVIIGFVLFGFSAPLIYYYFAKSKHSKSIDPEIEILARQGQKNLEEQEKHEK